MKVSRTTISNYEVDLSGDKHTGVIKQLLRVAIPQRFEYYYVDGSMDITTQCKVLFQLTQTDPVAVESTLERMVDLCKQLIGEA